MQPQQQPLPLCIPRGRDEGGCSETRTLLLRSKITPCASPPALLNNTQISRLPGALQFWEWQSHLYVSIKRELQAWNILYYFFFPFLFLKQPASENLHGQIIKRLQLGLAAAHLF